jgi:hypothetical protein
MIPTFLLGGIGRSGGSSDDPSFASVVFLAHCDGADASTTLTDVKGHAMTANGNAQIDTAQSKFGGASALFDGTGDYWSSGDSADWFFSTGDFTIEAWVRVPSITSVAQRTIIAQYNSTGNQRAWALVLDTAGVAALIVSYDGTATTFAAAGSAVSLTTWQHIAAVRSGANLTIYLDGTGGTPLNIAANSVFNSTDGLRFGALRTGGAVANFMDGWIDECRVTKGVARYTANFTPPIAAFPDS